MRKVEKLSPLGWLIYSDLAGLFSLIVVTLAHFNNIFMLLLGFVYATFNGFIVVKLMKLLNEWDFIGFEKPIISRKEFECWFIVNLTLIVTNYLLLPLGDPFWMQPFVIIFDIFELIIIGMTLMGIATCFGNHFRYWFFKRIRKLQRTNVFHNIREIDKMLTVSSDDRPKNETKIKSEPTKPISLK